jgi:hypothetical protein
VFLSKVILRTTKKSPKNFRTQPTEEVKTLTSILHHSGTNPEERKRIEDEQEAWDTLNAMFEDKEKELLKTVRDQA